MEIMNDRNLSLIAQFFVTLLLGIVTVILQLQVWCSDPGIVSRREDLWSEEAIQNFMDLNDEELKVQHSDPIYQKSLYYRHRQCETCLLSRPPKASHCGICGHCVHGWDHHCVALNNCVGRRNFRAFVAFLIISVTFGVMVIISCLLILMIDRDYCPSSNYLRFGTLCGLVMSAFTLFMTVKARC